MDLELLLSDYIKMGMPPICSHCCSTTMTINHWIELVPSAVHRSGCAVAASSRLRLTAAKGAQVPLRIITCAQRSGGKFSNLFSGTARDAQAIRFFFSSSIFSLCAPSFLHWADERRTGAGSAIGITKNAITALCVGDMRKLKTMLTPRCNYLPRNYYLAGS